MKRFIVFLFALIVLTSLVFSIANADSPEVIIPVLPDQSEYDCWALGDYDDSWGVVRIGAPEVHADNITGEGVKLCIVDTGIDYTHPELAAIYKGGYDFVNEDDDPMDDHYHGTHCAGIAAAAIADGTTVGGVAPSVELYACKVLSSSGMGYWYDIIDALDWCIANDMDVLSFSLGGASTTTDLEAAFQRAWDAGIVIIAAAGNAGGSETTDKVLYPARYNTVMAVAATDMWDQRATFSSTGQPVEVAAPGVDVYSCVIGGEYATKSGTSMACPHVSGIASLVVAAHPIWPNYDVRGQIRGTVTDLGPEGKDFLYGFGLVNAVAACGQLVDYPDMPSAPPLPTSPTVVTQNPTDITETTAILHGQVTDLGEMSTYVRPYFLVMDIGIGVQYRTPYLPSMYAPGEFSYDLSTFLEPGVYYQVIACAASDQSKLGHGSYVSFKTLGPDRPPIQDPSCVTLNATEIQPYSVRLNGKVLGLGSFESVSAKFYVGYAGSGVSYACYYETVTTPKDISAVITQSTSGTITIQPNKSYRFALAISTEGRSFFGGWLEFTTPPEGPPPTQYTLTTAVIGQGSVTGGGTYEEGTVVPVEAIPAEGWKFDYWTGDLSGSTNPTSITMDSNKSVTAHFSQIPVPIKYTLTTNVVGNGSVIPSSGEYDEGTIVPIRAIPAEGWEFDYWSGDLSGSTNPTSITMNSNKSVTAHFKELLPPPPPRELIVDEFTFEGGAKEGSGLIRILDKDTGDPEAGVLVQILAQKKGKVEYFTGTTNSSGEINISMFLTPGDWDISVIKIYKADTTCELPSSKIVNVTPK